MKERGEEDVKVRRRKRRSGEREEEKEKVGGVGGRDFNQWVVLENNLNIEMKKGLLRCLGSTDANVLPCMQISPALLHPPHLSPGMLLWDFSPPLGAASQASCYLCLGISASLFQPCT